MIHFVMTLLVLLTLNLLGWRNPARWWWISTTSAKWNLSTQRSLSKAEREVKKTARLYLILACLLVSLSSLFIIGKLYEMVTSNRANYVVLAGAFPIGLTLAHPLCLLFRQRLITEADVVVRKQLEKFSLRDAKTEV